LRLPPAIDRCALRFPAGWTSELGAESAKCGQKKRTFRRAPQRNAQGKGKRKKIGGRSLALFFDAAIRTGGFDFSALWAFSHNFPGVISHLNQSRGFLLPGFFQHAEPMKQNECNSLLKIALVY